MSYAGVPDAPGIPPILTGEALIAGGLARTVPVGKSGSQTYISPEGHRALVDNQRERAAYNRAHRGRSTP